MSARPIVCFVALTLSLATGSSAQSLVAWNICPAVSEPLRSSMTVLIDPLVAVSQAEGRAVIVTGVGQPSYGHVAVRLDGSLVYTTDTTSPPANSPSFPFTVSDGVQSATARIYLNNPCPHGVPAECAPDDDEFTFGPADVGSQSLLDVLSNDLDCGSSIFSVVPPGAADVVAGNPTDQLLYTVPDPGNYYFEYETGEVGDSEFGGVHVHVGTGGGGGPPGIEMGEIGTVIAGDGSPPTVVPLLRHYDVPVVFAMPATRKYPQGSPAPAIAAVARVTEVGSDYFVVEIDTVGFQNTQPQLVDYLVVEAGRWNIPGTGQLLVTNVTETTAVVPEPPGPWNGQGVDLPVFADSQGTPVKPVVLAQIQSEANLVDTPGGNDPPRWLNTRIRGVAGGASSGFAFALERKSGDTDAILEDEAVGWLAIAPGSGPWGSADSLAAIEHCATWGQGSPPQTTRFCTLPFGGLFETPPKVVANVASWNQSATHPDIHLRRNEAVPNGVAVLSEANNEDLHDLREDPHDVAFLALHGGNGSLLAAQPVNRPPRVPAFDEASATLPVPPDPGGLTYVPQVADPDSGDTFTIVDLEHDAPPVGWTIAIQNGTQIRLEPGPSAGQFEDFRFRYRVSDGEMRSRWAVVEVEFESGVVVTAVDDHYLSIPELFFIEGEQEQTPSGWAFYIPESILLTNDFWTGQAEYGIGIRHLYSPFASCGGVFRELPNGDRIVFFNYYNGGEGCLEREVTFQYWLCELGRFGQCRTEDVEDYDLATVTVWVEVPNRPPVAADDDFAIQRGLTTYFPVLANDSDPDGTVPSVVSPLLSQPPHAAQPSEVLSDGTISYTASETYLGNDGFDYQITDAEDPPLTDTANVTIEVTRDLAWESFHNDSPPRAPGQTLDGVEIHEGRGPWRATNLGFAAGEVTTTAGSTGGYAGLRLPEVPLGPASTVVIEGHARVTGAPWGWAGLGFAAHETSPLRVDGTLWVRLDHFGNWILFRDGDTAVLASGQSQTFDPDRTNTVRLEYERLPKHTLLPTVAVWINGVRVLEELEVEALLPAEHRVLGFQLRHPPEAPEGALAVDDVLVYYRDDPTPLVPVVADDFAPTSVDREPGRPLDRAWTPLEESRWKARSSTFGADGTLIVPGIFNPFLGAEGGAILAFSPENFPGEPVFFDSTFTIGNANNVAVGFSQGSEARFEKGGGTLWLSVGPSGPMGFWSLAAFDDQEQPLELASGWLTPFYPDEPMSVRVELTTPTSFQVWIDHAGAPNSLQQGLPTASGVLPTGLRPSRGAGMQMVYKPGVTPSGSFDDFAVGVIQESNE